MENMIIGICENSNTDCQHLLQHLRTAEKTLHINMDLRIYTTGLDFLNNYCPIYDIVFLSTDLPDIKGEQFVHSFRKLDPQTYTVLMGESNKIYQMGYAYRINTCWRKPLLYDNTLNEIKILLKYEHFLSRPFVHISNNNSFYKIYLDKLRYIETNKRHLVFHYSGEDIYDISKLSDWAKELAPHFFFRCNNSYIVNVKYVEKVVPDGNRYKICLITGEEIPLSRNKKKELIEKMDALKKSFNE